nr:hypothetical protein [Pandoravirus massiliensis]
MRSVASSFFGRQESCRPKKGQCAHAALVFFDEQREKTKKAVPPFERRHFFVGRFFVWALSIMCTTCRFFPRSLSGCRMFVAAYGGTGAKAARWRSFARHPFFSIDQREKQEEKATRARLGDVHATKAR